MPERKFKEFSDEYSDLCWCLEWQLNIAAKAYNLSWKTPPHDIVIWIMEEVVELTKVEP